MAELKTAEPEVVVYTTMWCPYCHRAKGLLEGKGVAFHEIDVTFDPAKRAEMSARAEGRTSVPQIFINGKPIGGSDDLAALEAAGKLDRLLGRAA
jgi:glutaredoxin 3